MRIKLNEFRIQNFRCIDDTNWINLEDITALVGVNESGKTALLHALCTLNPGSGELDIDYIRDFPRKRLTSQYNEDCLIAEGRFLIPNEYLKKKGIIQKFKTPPDDDIFLVLSRRYDKKLYYEFSIQIDKKFIPDLKSKLQEVRMHLSRKKVEEKKQLSTEIESENEEIIRNAKETKEEKEIFTEKIKNLLIALINQYIKEINSKYDDNNLFQTDIDRKECSEFISKINQSISKYYGLAEVELKPILDYLEGILIELQDKSLSHKLFEEIKEDIPVFIYFEDYNILEGSINILDLVKAIEGDLKFKEFRIQETLFKHVSLDPNEIYELGSTKLTQEQENQLNQRIQQRNINVKQITEEFYEKISKEKQQELKKRKILLDSASQLMTETLNKYFQERKYRVEYDTDGQFLQILIWDDVKTSKINLEERSKGFRWYFSFFLVFLVESEGMHRNAILLLDEPGIHLHLQAQFNLINFFQKLKETNQIIYTTHSPFLIDENHLEQVRSVFEDEKGITHVTDNNLIPDKKSVFPLQAALSYRTSQVIYQGLKQLLVEGDSDYNYIKAINYILEKTNKSTLDKDIVIIPCKSASKIDMYARLFIDLENIPVVLLDYDDEGKKVFEVLTNTLFAQSKKNVLMINDFIKCNHDLEIEDLIGKDLLVEVINKNNLTDSLVSPEDIEDGPFVDKIVSYCKKNKIEFKDKIDWKYQLSLKFKNDIFNLNTQQLTEKIEPRKIKTFENLIKKINTNAKKKIID